MLPLKIKGGRDIHQVETAAAVMTFLYAINNAPPPSDPPAPPEEFARNPSEVCFWRKRSCDLPPQRRSSGGRRRRGSQLSR